MTKEETLKILKNNISNINYEFVKEADKYFIFHTDIADNNFGVDKKTKEIINDDVILSGCFD